MTKPNDLIRRGDALDAIQEYAVQQVGAFQQPTLKGAADAINAIPAATVSPEVLALVAALRELLGRTILYCGGDHLPFAGHTDVTLVGQARAAIAAWEAKK